MSTLLEVLVTCDSNNTLWNSSIWDAHTGTNLMTYKGGGTLQSRTLSFIGKDYIAAVEKSKPILHIWPLNSHQTVQGMRFILPGKASSLAISSDGCYIVAGIEDKIYLWQTASGNLLSIISRHYQKITILKFSPDGKYFISAAEDGMVLVWCLATVASHPEVNLVTQTSAGQHDPICMFTDHSLPVTDLCISKTGMHGRLFTASSDRTSKIYDLPTGEMLVNLVFDGPLSSIVLDVLELNMFVGTVEGDIHQISLKNPPRNRDVLVNTDKDVLTFSSHTKAVTCLSVSLDGETLMSAADDEQVILWHIPTKQAIRILRHKGPITNAFFTINYPAIYKQDFSPNIILHSLDRTLERDADDVTEIEVLVKKKNNFWPETDNSVNVDIPMRQLDSTIKSNEGKLKNEIDQLKTINANLYSLSIQKALESVPVIKKKNKKLKRKSSG